MTSDPSALPPCIIHPQLVSHSEPILPYTAFVVYFATAARRVTETQHLIWKQCGGQRGGNEARVLGKRRRPMFDSQQKSGCWKQLIKSKKSDKDLLKEGM